MNSGLFKMGSPFFSIIIPTYNSGKTLSACLESIVKQSFQNFEVIIVDGVSSDNTFSIVKHFKERYQNIQWMSEKDNGIYDAMNKGVKMAKGEWLYFLGSDDLIHSKQVLNEIFSLNKNGYCVVYGNAKIIGNTSWAKDGDLYDGKFDLQKLLKKNICHQAIFYNKICFSGNSLFNVDYKLCADLDFNLRCWANTPFLYINLIIADFYGGGESTKYNADQKFSEDFNKNILDYFSSKKLDNIDVQSVSKNLTIRLKKWINQLVGFK